MPRNILGWRAFNGADRRLRTRRPVGDGGRGRVIPIDPVQGGPVQGSPAYPPSAGLRRPGPLAALPPRGGRDVFIFAVRRLCRRRCQRPRPPGGEGGGLRQKKKDYRWVEIRTAPPNQGRVPPAPSPVLRAIPFLAVGIPLLRPGGRPLRVAGEWGWWGYRRVRADHVGVPGARPAAPPGVGSLPPAADDVPVPAPPPPRVRGILPSPLRQF